VAYVWQISLLSKLADESLANLLYQLIVGNIKIANWRIKVWQIFSISQIRQTKATPKFHRLCMGTYLLHDGNKLYH